VRNLLNQLSAGLSLRRGASGFFATRRVMPWLQQAGTIEATSFYDISESAQGSLSMAIE
jgi:NTE family protein